MGVKKRISLGMLTVTLGLSLISGGTFAYFNETEETEGTFSAGTLEVGLETGEENNTMINIGHLKPGDWIERDVTLKNEGSLDIGSVLLDTSFEVDESDFANYILVTISKSDSNQSPGNGKGPDGKGPPGLGNKPSHSPKDKNIIKNIPLHELEEQEQELLEGIDDSEKLTVTFEFEKTEDQNHLQGETLTFDWIFKAMQTDGEER